MADNGIGARLTRKEDDRHLRGRGEFRRGNRESRGACEHAADIKVASLRRARVGRNGDRTTGNCLVPSCNNGG
jgi:hypothetical protein